MMATVRGVCLLLLLVLASLCNGFNIDIGSPVTHFGQTDSMFGFAVAQYKYSGRSQLLVGAPRYETEQKARGVSRAGAVLQCSPDIPNECAYIPFDRNGNNVHPLGEQLDSKSNQWFGATVSSSGVDGVVVACAPRYVWFTENLKRRDPVGTCYVARKGLTDFQEFAPCRTRNWGYHRQGSCQAGFDAVITDDSSRMFIGAPGAFYWQGQIHSQSLSARNDYQMTYEGPAVDDDQYLGYAVAVGDFNGDGIQDVALGVPKGLNYTGKIALYTHNLEPLQNITGYQLGSYFGYCLTVVDFNNDGLDDIIVGSPMYTDFDDQEMRFEVGRVHVILQNRLHRFRQIVTFNGEVNRGRFGLSLTGLSDINMDGIDDIAVGAPYGGEDGNGAVFIYHGFEIRSGELISEEMTKPAQVIYASSLSHQLTTFGWSLSGGLDMDNNLYPDLLVGSYASNAAVLFKSRPIVNLFNHTLSFVTEGKTVDIESAIHEDTGCYTSSGRSVTCVTLEFCIGYRGVGVPSDLELFVEYILDEKVNEPRLFFIANEKRNLEEQVQLESNITSCKVHEVYVTSTVIDKLTPMAARVKYDLVEPSYRRAPRSLTPILNQRQDLSLIDSITIQKNCGPDNVCIPDLILTFVAPETYVSDKKSPLEIDIRVINNAEDAFEARVYVPVPAGLSYTNFMAKDNTSVTCFQRAMGSNVTIICDIGNPLPLHLGVHFGMSFEPLGEPEDNQFLFLVTANSTNGETLRTSEDNVAQKSVMIDADTQLIPYGSSDPENIEYNRTLYDVKYKSHEKHLGPEIMHKYGLLNDGPSHVMESEVVILWPTKTLSGNYLLYLVDQPLTDGAVNCSIVPDVNPMNLRLVEKTNVDLSKLQGNEGSTRQVEVEGDYTEETYVSGDSYGSGGSESSSSSSSSSETHYSSSGDGSSYSSSSSSSSRTTYTSSSSSSKTSYSSSSSSSQSSGENELVRITRQASEPFDWDTEVNKCGPTECTRIHCSVGLLTAQDIVYIYIRSRLMVDTLENYPKEDVSISSRMLARVKRLPHGVSPDIIPACSYEVSTPVSPAKSLDEAPPIPWWVIVLATMAGILILLIIILILWKCGYFKRNRPEQRGRISDDAQPLNPPNGHNGHNGHNYSPYSRPYYPGDEAL